MTQSTIIIAVSGESHHINNVIAIQDSISQFSDSLSIIIVFDQKDSALSTTNYETLTKELRSNTRIIVGRFKSVGDVRNAALSEISTPWFSFCDADDRLIPENYLRLIRDAEKIEAELALGSYIFTEIGKTPRQFSQVEDSLDWKSAARNPGIWRYIYKTATFSHIQFPSLNMAEDQIYLSQVYLANPTIKISALPIYEYIKQESGSLTSTRAEIDKIAAALDISDNLKYSTVRTYRRIQRAFLTTQLLTSIKTVRFFRKPSYIHKLILHSLSGSISDIFSSLSFLSFCLRRKK